MLGLHSNSLHNQLQVTSFIAPHDSVEEAKDLAYMVRNVSKVNFQTKHIQLKGVQSRSAALVRLSVQYKEPAKTHAKHAKS